MAFEQLQRLGKSEPVGSASLGRCFVAIAPKRDKANARSSAASPR
ncbi:hypothetical protein [Thermoleptolyngbya sp. C42_A2020_037]|nr:hypothetical protein [Thermoleptolyngbya sp. C42_A2020_037]